MSSLVMDLGFELGKWNTGILFIEEVEYIQPVAPARFQPCPCEGPRPDSLD